MVEVGQIGSSAAACILELSDAMHWGITTCVLVGCAEPQDRGECACIAYDVTSRTDIDRLHAMPAHGLGESEPIRTPAILAGEPVPMMFEVYAGSFEISEQFFAPPTRTARVFHGRPRETFAVVVAVGFSGDAIVGADFQALNYVPEGELYKVATGTLDLGTLEPEVWNGCVRFGSTNTTTRYVVKADDLDCDGIENADDCQPHAFCTPAATSPAAIAACTCP